MKKLFAISILLTLLTAAAFAQFGFKITGEFYPDLLLITAPTGDAVEVNSDKTLASSGNATVPYGGVGTFDFLTASDWPNGKGLTALFSYKERDQERYGGQLGLSLGWLIDRGAALFKQADVSDRTAATGVTFVDLLSSGIGDWDLWGKIGIFKGFVGNTGDDGVVSTFDGPFTFLTEGVKYNDYGIIFPSAPDGKWNYYGTGSGTNVRGLKTFPVAQAVGISTLDGASAPGLADRPYFSVTADVAPIKVAVAGDMSNTIKGEDNGLVNPEGYSTVGAAIRLSGEKIADLVSFDAIYKFAGGDYDSENKRSNNSQPDGTGNWGHAFGLYANLHLLDTLGIGLGYSGFTSVQEKYRDPSNEEFTFRLPYYNGVDLHFNFTGVDKLNISLNNNVSFATQKGSDSESVYTVGLSGSASKYQPTWSSGSVLSDSDVSDGYLALSNALGVKYNISDPLYVSFELANRLYSYTLTAKVNDARGRSKEEVEKYGSDDLRATLGANYSFGDNVSLGTGLIFDLLSYSHYVSEDKKGNENWDWGKFTFGIPVYFKVVLP